MVLHAKLPKVFWDVAIRLDDDVLNRVWIGNDVSYKHFNVFGCCAVIYVPKY